MESTESAIPQEESGWLDKTYTLTSVFEDMPNTSPAHCRYVDRSEPTDEQAFKADIAGRHVGVANVVCRFLLMVP